MAEKMVDKVVRISEKPNNIRNIAICAHIDHGKTTFSDNLLAGAGMMSKEDAGKALKLDFSPDGVIRVFSFCTITVSLAYLPCTKTSDTLTLAGAGNNLLRCLPISLTCTDIISGPTPSAKAFKNKSSNSSSLTFFILIVT